MIDSDRPWERYLDIHSLTSFAQPMGFFLAIWSKTICLVKHIRSEDLRGCSYGPPGSIKVYWRCWSTWCVVTILIKFQELILSMSLLSWFTLSICLGVLDRTHLQWELSRVFPYIQDISSIVCGTEFVKFPQWDIDDKQKQQGIHHLGC